MRPRLLHVNVGHPWSGQYGILAGLLTPGARVLTVEHSAMAPANGVQRTLRALLNTRLDARVAVADETARRLERTTVAPRGSIEVIHNGVADLAVTSIPQRGSQPTIGFAGRFTHEKGADVLLRALAQLTGVTAVLVGDGELRPASEVLASELGVADRAIFTGWREDARELMATWDVFVLPSRREGFGISIVEAMLAGLPVVATSVGGVPEVVVDGENAILVPPDDPGALAVAIRRLLDDPQLRRRLGQSGRRRALERFSPQTMATAFLALYARLLQDT
jgi:glycosyltransferase involved in cell wall biosynthesis